MSLWSEIGKWVGRQLGKLTVKEARKIEEAAKEELKEKLNTTTKLILVVAVVSLTSACVLHGIGDFLGGVKGGYVDCVKHPETCVPRATPTPTSTPEPQLPLQYCSADLRCGCWICIDNERDRLGLAPSAPCVHPAYVRCLATPTPEMTATPTPAPTNTPSPAPTAVPTAAPTPQPKTFADACMLDGPPWLIPTPPKEAMPVERAGQCPPGFGEIAYTDPNSSRVRRGCVVDWKCAPGTNGRSPFTGARGSVPGHVRFDDLGFISDVDNGHPCGTDALGRKECGGVLTPSFWEGKEEKPWVNPGAACDPPKCADVAPTPQPTTGPTPVPSTSCAPVEAIEHWIVGGGHCHASRPMADGRIRCTLDSTIRPICDRDHTDNWNSFCGGRDHDPDYASPSGAQLWFIDGAEDLGPNPENSAQRVVAGAPGARMLVKICLRPDAKTVDGCRIPIRGDGCFTADPWNLPSN